MEKREGHGTPKGVNKTSAPHLHFFFKMQDLCVSDEGLRKLACWVPKQPRKNVFSGRESDIRKKSVDGRFLFYYM